MSQVPFGRDEVVIGAWEEGLIPELIEKDFEVFGLMYERGDILSIGKRGLLVDGVLLVFLMVELYLLVHFEHFDN